MKAIKVHGWVALTDDFELMMISALRYAIGRSSYLPLTAIEYTRYLIPQLSVNTLGVMKRDIKEEIDRRKRLHKENPKYFGNLYMAEEWEKLAEDMTVAYLNKKMKEDG